MVTSGGETHRGSKGQQAAVNAILLLHDGGAEITPDSIASVLTAAGIETAESYWGSLYCCILQTVTVDTLLIGIGGTKPGTNKLEEELEEDEEPFVLFDLMWGCSAES